MLTALLQVSLVAAFADAALLAADLPHRPFSVNFGIGRRSVRVELQVTREIRSDIHTGDGSITVTGLRGETRLSTGDGRIRARTIRPAQSAHRRRKR